MRTAPEELTSTLVLMPRAPGAPRTATLLLCYAGLEGTRAAEADAAIEPLLEIGTVETASITECRYAEVLEDARQPAGVRLVARNILVDSLDDGVVDAVDRLSGTAPVVVALRSLGGAFARVPAGATAFAHRDAEVMVQCGLIVPQTATEDDVEAALEPWRAVAAYGTGTYLNFQGSATAADLAAGYPSETHARLVEVKRAYDPDNRFALNHNIAPDGQVTR
jgi:hypothetical protein